MYCVAHAHLRPEDPFASSFPSEPHLCVGGSRECGALPREEVEHAAVFGEPEETHLLGGRVVGHHLQSDAGGGA